MKMWLACAKSYEEHFLYSFSADTCRMWWWIKNYINRKFKEHIFWRSSGICDDSKSVTNSNLKIHLPCCNGVELNPHQINRAVAGRCLDTA
jgi:hypothetical protein